MCPDVPTLFHPCYLFSPQFSTHFPYFSPFVSLPLLFLNCMPDSCTDIRQFVELTFSSGGGLGMGVSEIKDCKASYLRTEGGVKVCADGNATNNWDTPPEGGWGFYNNSKCQK